MVVRGEGPAPSAVLAQIQGLPPESLSAALMAGGRQLRGWGEDRRLAAESFDMLSVLVRAAGNWKSKPPEIPAYPRPKADKSNGSATPSKPKRRVSVRELHAQMKSGPTPGGSRG